MWLETWRNLPVSGENGQMGQDDANDDGPGECPGHEFELSGLVTVRLPGQLIPGLAQEFACRYCGTVDYQPSVREQT
jgi:hypothetical protein